jgi:DNA invertase Pin-like site-specific DNA recombinase
MFQMCGVFAEFERWMIRERVNADLARAKANGVKLGRGKRKDGRRSADGLVTLGNPRLHVPRKSAVEAVKAEADRYAANVLPIIREAQKAGASTLRQIAEALNARGIPTARGGQWYAQSVANILERA